MALPAELRERLLVRDDVPLGPFTTLGVGGPARHLIEPRSREELLFAIEVLRRHGVAWRVLGGGSNVLIGDEGVDEVVVSTRHVGGIWHHGEETDALRVAAGTSLARLVGVAQRQGLSGLEPLIGIPGTVGGAVAGNAGGRHGWIGDVVTAATVVGEDGAAEERAVGAGDFGYRTSPFRGEVIVDVVLRLRSAPPEEVLARTEAVLTEKRATQPLAARSSGCFFRNTADAPGGKLIDEAGCKGLAVGGAEVSRRHANFLLNTGGASAKDLLDLAREVRERVERSSGRRLELEIEVWGEQARAAS